jgi:hypothetical protein
MIQQWGDASIRSDLSTIYMYQRDDSISKYDENQADLVVPVVFVRLKFLSSRSV